MCALTYIHACGRVVQTVSRLLACDNQRPGMPTAMKTLWIFSGTGRRPNTDSYRPSQWCLHTHIFTASTTDMHNIDFLRQIPEMLYEIVQYEYRYRRCAARSLLKKCSTFFLQESHSPGSLCDVFKRSRFWHHGNVCRRFSKLHMIGDSLWRNLRNACMCYGIYIHFNAECGSHRTNPNAAKPVCAVELVGAMACRVSRFTSIFYELVQMGKMLNIETESLAWNRHFIIGAHSIYPN